MADIKIKMGVEGDAAFKSSLTGINAKLKALDSETKKVDAAEKKFGKTEDTAAKKAKLLAQTTEAYQQKMDLLKKQLEKNEKKLKDLSDAYDEAQKSGDPARIAKATTAYNRQAAQVANLQSQMNRAETAVLGLGDSMDDTTADAGELNSSLNDIKTNTDFTATTKAIGTITSALETAVSQVIEFGRKTWDLVSDSSDWADDLLTRASQYGIDPETLQEYDYASRFTDTSTDVMIAARTRLVQKLKGVAQEEIDTESMTAEALKKLANEVINGAWGEGEDRKKRLEAAGYNYEEVQKVVNAILAGEEVAAGAVVSMGSSMAALTSQEDEELTGTAEIFDKLGVSVRDANGELRNSDDIFWDAIEALGEIENPTTRDAIAMELFSKSAMELNPLIKLGRDAFNDLRVEAGEMGYIVGEENVEKLGKFNDALQRMDAAMDTAKHNVSANLADPFSAVADAVSEAMIELSQWAKSEEGQAAFSALSDAIIGLVETLATPENMKAAVDAITGSVNALADGFRWIADNKEGVVTALEAIGAAFALLKVSETVLSFMQLIKMAKWKLPTSGGGAAPSTGGGWLSGAGGWLAGAGKNVVQWGKNAGSKIAQAGKGALNWSKGAVAAATPHVAHALTAAAPAAAMAGGSYLLARGLDSAAVRRFNEYQQYSDDVAEAAENAGNIVTAAFSTIDDAIHNEEAGDWGERLQTVRDFFAGLSEEELQALRDASGNNEIFDSVSQQMGETLTEKMANFLRSEMSTATISNGVSDLLNGLGQSIASGDYTQYGQPVGADMGDGIVAGLESKRGEVAAMAEKIALAAKQSIQEALDIHSPSRVMAALGAYTGEGFAEGITKSYDAISRAMGGVRVLAAQAMPTSNNYNNNSSVNFNVANMNVRRDSDVRDLANEIAHISQRELRGRGARMA